MRSLTLILTRLIALCLFAFSACADDDAPPTEPDSPLDLPSDAGVDTGTPKLDSSALPIIDDFLGVWTREAGSLSIDCEAPLEDKIEALVGGSFVIGEGFDSDLVYFNTQDCSIEMDHHAKTASALPGQSCNITDHAEAFYDHYTLEWLSANEIHEQASIRVTIEALGQLFYCVYAIEARLVL